MERGAPEYHNNSWIWWSLGAVVLTAAVTILFVGILTGNWPWNRGGAVAEITDPIQTVGTTVPTEETTVPTEAVISTTVPDETTEVTTAPTEPEKPAPTEPTKPAPTEPTKPEQTEPEETEPEQTQPTSRPTEPEEENNGGGETPQPGDIDVPISPRP